MTTSVLDKVNLATRHFHVSLCPVAGLPIIETYHDKPIDAITTFFNVHDTLLIKTANPHERIDLEAGIYKAIHGAETQAMWITSPIYRLVISSCDDKPCRRPTNN